MQSYQYRKSHCGDKTVVRSSYLHNGISYIGKMTSLYWIRAQLLESALSTVLWFNICFMMLVNRFSTNHSSINISPINSPRAILNMNSKYLCVCWKCSWYYRCYLLTETDMKKSLSYLILLPSWPGDKLFHDPSMHDLLTFFSSLDVSGILICGLFSHSEWCLPYEHAIDHHQDLTYQHTLIHRNK